MRVDNLLWVSVGTRDTLWSRLLWLSLGTCVGVASLVFLLALVTGLQSLILTHIVGLVPDQLEVQPASLTVGPLEFKSAGLDDSLLDKLRTMSGVTAVYRRARFNMPSELTAHFHSLPFATDIIIEGVDEGLLQPEFGTAFSVQPDGQPAPAVLASSMVDMLNAGLSVEVGGPSLSHNALVGIPFDLLLGRSSFHEAASYTTFSCKLLGVSDHVVVSGPTLPMGYLERWTQQLHAQPPYIYAAVLQLDSPERLESVANQVEAMGLRCPKQDQATHIVRASRVVQVALVGFCGILLVVAGVGIANGLAMMVHEERTDIGLLRALGARRRDVLWIFLVRAGLAGLLGSVGGVAVGVLLIWAVPHLASHWLPAALQGDTDWLKVTPLGVGGPVLFGTGASLAAGLVPSRQAADLRPADALRGGE